MKEEMSLQKVTREKMRQVMQNILYEEKQRYSIEENLSGVGRVQLYTRST